MRDVHLEEAHVGQHAPHVVFEVLPAAAAAESRAADLEVVDDDEAALLEVLAQRGRFVVGHLPPPDFDDVGDGILEQFRIVERQAVDLLDVRRRDS